MNKETKQYINNRLIEVNGIIKNKDKKINELKADIQRLETKIDELKKMNEEMKLYIERIDRYVFNMAYRY